MVTIESNDVFKVSCDCGEIFYVEDWCQGDEVSCVNENCSRSFSVDVDRDTVAFGDMPA